MTEEVAVASSAHPSAGERCDSTIPNDTSSSSGSSTTPASLQSSSPPSPYQVLGIAAGASMPEAKAAFQRLARLHHPDKATKDSDPADFIAIQEAWNILSDPASKEQLDRKMAIGRFAPIADAVELDELERYEDCDVYFKECRCGGIYEVDMAELQAGISCFPCQGCSLHIRIISE